MPGRTLAGPTKEGFTGKEQDAESGLDYFGARYYMPALARWTAVDPLAEKHPEWSPYNYVLNDPLALIDPDGRQVSPNQCPNCHDAARPTPEESMQRLLSTSRHCDVQCRDVGLESQGLGPLEWAGLGGVLGTTGKQLAKGVVRNIARQELRKVGRDAAQEGAERIGARETSRIQAFADRHNVDVSVVGSRAAGTSSTASDWDYLIGGTAKMRKAARRELPRGTRGGEIVNGRETGIDVFNLKKEPLDPNKPHVTFEPKPQQ